MITNKKQWIQGCEQLQWASSIRIILKFNESLLLSGLVFTSQYGFGANKMNQFLLTSDVCALSNYFLNILILWCMGCNALDFFTNPWLPRIWWLDNQVIPTENVFMHKIMIFFEDVNSYLLKSQFIVFT